MSLVSQGQSSQVLVAVHLLSRSCHHVVLVTSLLTANNVTTNHTLTLP